jgi:hypothetical protein
MPRKRVDPKLKTSKRGAPIKWTKAKLSKLAEEILEYYDTHLGEFQLLSFLNHKKIHRTQWVELVELSPELSDANKIIKQILEHRVVNMGADARNPTFTIFNLKHNYGWKDKQIIEQKTDLTVNGSLADMLAEAESDIGDDESN